MDNKKYYWIISGKYYEVPEDTYKKFKKEYDHARMLRKYEAEAMVLSMDMSTSAGYPLVDSIEDPTTNSVEDKALHNVLLEQMRNARESLPPEEQLLLELLFDQGKSQDEASEITGIPQRTISYRLQKILNKIREIMGIKK